MRLIDADSFKKFLTKLYEVGAPYDGIIELLDKEETAYDVDKVVEQLEDRSTLSRPVGWSKSYEIVTLEDAIEIVKGGGVNE